MKLPPLRLAPAALGLPEVPVLVGVSGGRDSVALFQALRERGHAHLIVCHLDHGWRAESAAEAHFVQNLAAQAGAACEMEQATPPPVGEAAARHCRLAFFARAAQRHGCDSVYLAHHADDQAETVLHHLLRGTGTAGLAGMAPLSTQVIDGFRLQLRRPLLGVWREEITAFLHARALAWCEDSSNPGTGPTRNRLRHLVLPELERALGRNVRPALWRCAETLAAEDEWMESQPELQEVPAELLVARVRGLHLALQRRLLHRWLQARGVPRVEFDDVENVRALLTPGGPAKVNLSAGRHARRRAGRLWVED